LLIAWGLLKFVDFFRFRAAGDNRPLFSGGEVALLLLVIFAGSAITTAANVSPELGHIFEMGDIDFWDITGNNYTYEQHVEQENVAAGAEIEILNMFGNIEVRAGETDRIIVDATKIIRASNRQEADRLEQDFTFSIRHDGAKYLIRSNRDEAGGPSSPRQRFKSSLTIQVPKQVALRLDNRNGRILIQDVSGDQAVINRYGDVEVRNITGRVELENRNGNVFVQDVSAAVAITNRYSNTTVRNVGGDLRIETRNGDVEVSGVAGAAAIENSYAPIRVEDVKGALTITGRNNQLEVQRVEGDIHAESSYQNVSVRDPRGAVTLTGRNGDMFVSFDRPPEKDVSIDSSYANILVELPSDSAFRIDARTEYGEVFSEFDGLNINRANRERIITGEVSQNGPRFNISTRNGAIRIRRKG
jgi:DUF4097 and DUF4098 domain-containing protein YvlB